MIGAGEVDWEKMQGLAPAIVQDDDTGAVLMLGYMNKAAMEATVTCGFVTFFSRSKGRLWRKGETSGYGLALSSVHLDCDGDALLIRARPEGPTCHLGTASCFGGEVGADAGWIGALGRIVAARAKVDPAESYTARLLGEGIGRIAQKIGEEGVEVALAAVSRDDASCVDEAADLLYHLTVMLEARGLRWGDVIARLKARHS